MRKKIYIANLIILSIFLFPTTVSANTTLTVEEVRIHNTPDDCYMIFENKVYDITKDRLQFHDAKYLDIEDWCGKDITEDFKDKDGEGHDHIPSSYTLLEQYYIGDLSVDSDAETTDTTTSKIASRYNIAVPTIIMLILFFTSRYLKSRRGKDDDPILKQATYKAFWNIVLLGSLVPSGIFGIFMILRTKYPELYKIQGDILFWHVEGGIVFVNAILIHLLDRIMTLVAQIKAIGR